MLGIKRTFVAGVVGCALLAAVVAPAGAATVVPKRALFVGDSITFESRYAIAHQFSLKKGWTVTTHAYQGTSPCDWLGWITADLAATTPTIVSIETVGNNATPCMADADGVPLPFDSPEWLTKLDADLDTLVAQIVATGAKVLLVAGPPLKTAIWPAWPKGVTDLNATLVGVAGRHHGVSVTNAPRLSVSANGKYTDTKPCLATETAAQGCVAGKIIVRTQAGTQAGIHFCPPGLVYPYICSEYSSGEYRWGRTAANATAAPPAPVLP